MSNVAPVAPDLLHGVSLEQYAGVSVALAEGLPLEGILESEGIAGGAWSQAEVAWKVRVAKDAPEGQVFVALRAKRVVAEDCLARAVAPIDSDLAAWMSFLRAYGAHAAPFEMLQRAGIGLNDLARLQRSWAARMAKDAALEKQAADLARKDLGPLPPVRVGPVALKPFPWTRRAVATAPAAKAAAVAAVAPSETSMAPGQLRLYSYVAIKARLAARPGDEARVLREIGISDFGATDAGWQAIFASNPELERDYRRLFATQLAKARAAVSSASGAPPVASAPPATTPERPRAPNKLAGTSLAVEPSRGPAMPFAKVSPAREATAPVAEAPKQAPLVVAPRNKLAGTALAVEPPRGPALPFGATEAASSGVAARPASKLAGTSLAVDPPATAALPFSEAPALTLLQHASLACEIALAPERALETLARYQITPPQKAAADKHYAERFAREPGLREQWEEAKRSYAAFLAASKLNR